MATLVVVNGRRDWPLDVPGVEVVEVSYGNRDALVEMMAVRLIDEVYPQ